MGAIFSYSLVSGIILILLYIAYKFTMAGERQFALNRVMLFAIYAMALTLPAISPTLKGIQWNAPKTAAVEIDLSSDFGAYPVINVADAGQEWMNVLLWIYVVGVVLATARLIISIARILMLAKRKENRHLDNGYTLMLTDERSFSPFSFMRYIVISKADYEKSKEEILIHETTHLSKHHWIDQMFGNIAAIFLWYNPVAWLMIEELKSIHEYQADEAVIASGTDMRHYQYLLIEKAVGKRFPSPANSLNHSKLKKRVTMMYKSKPSAMRRMAGIAVIPAAIVALAITDVPAVAEVVSKAENTSILTVSDGKVSNFSSDEQVKAKEEAAEEPLKVIAAKAVKNDKDPQSAIMVPVQNLDEMQVVGYGNPDAKKEEKETASSGLQNIAYYVNGIETPAEIVESIDPNKIESIDVDKSNPQKGIIRITLKGKEKASTHGLNERLVYVDVEQVPEYPGGMNELMKFLAQNIRYPEEAMKQNIEGRVIVKFIVTKEGDVADPKIVKGVDPLLDQEAMRVVKAMPKWTPGKANDNAVDCFFTLPVNFRLKEDSSKEKTVKII